jgi:cyclic pyranopterin phosphate synthase
MKNTYLRIVATTACNYACPFCHMEGDPQQEGKQRGVSAQSLSRCLRVAARAGVHKYKFLGGEPLLRQDLPALIASLRQDAPQADISIISAGALRPQRLDRAFEAGLDRINVSIHGFGVEAMAKNHRAPARAHAMRAAFLARVLEYGRPLKLNYVYSDPSCLEDLGALLDWAAPRGILVNILDDLGQPLSWEVIAQVVTRLRGAPAREELCRDPHSLDTLHWIYADGLRVELKHQRLGEVAPFMACKTCPARQRCKEGIQALRLTHTGHLQPCMDREDLGLPLAQIIEDHGEEAALVAWLSFTESL